MMRYKDRSDYTLEKRARRIHSFIRDMLPVLCFLTLLGAFCTLVSLEVQAGEGGNAEGESGAAEGLFDFSLELDCFEEKNGTIFASGSKPRFTWDGCDAAPAYVRIDEIKPGNESRVYPVEGDMALELEEGEYEMLPYVVAGESVEEYDTGDSGGNVVYPEGFPIHLIYDDTAPAGVEFELETDALGLLDYDRDDYQVFAADQVRLIAVPGEDKGAGTEKVFLQCGSMEYESDRIVLKDGDSRNLSDVSAWCEDKCGNKSDISYLQIPGIIIDREKPAVKLEHSEDDDGVTFEINMKDTASALGGVQIKWNGKTLIEKNYLEEHRRIEEKNLEFRIDEEDIKTGGRENRLEVRVYDSCMNDGGVTALVKREKDETEPEIRISGIRNGGMTKGPVGLRVDIWDEDTDPGSIEMRAVRESYGARPESCDYVFGLGDSLVFNEDGSYVFTVAARDKTGNEASEELYFVIDRSGPVISGLERYDGKTLEEFSLADDIGSMFRDDTVVQYHLYLNGMDFSEYERVKEPGEYQIEVMAVDQLGNEGRSKARFRIGKRPEEGEQEITETEVLEGVAAGDQIVETVPGIEMVDIKSDETEGPVDEEVTKFTADAPAPQFKEGGGGARSFTMGAAVLAGLMVILFSAFCTIKKRHKVVENK